MTARRVRESGPPRTAAAPELVDSGFALENADAPFLHRGLNLADMAHVLDLARRGLVPRRGPAGGPGAAARGRSRRRAEDFPYDPELRRALQLARAPTSSPASATPRAGCTPGAPAARPCGSRCGCTCRRQIVELISETARFGLAAVDRAEEHAATVMPDQTYLQHAQPSTFGHYLLSFVYSAVRDAERLLGELDWVDASPGGAGCVNGTRLLDDREFIASTLGFSDVIEHTRDAMWQVDGLIAVLATSSSLLSTFCKLAEDLEIWSSSEFDYVDLDDGYTRASVLMPQKRNPYALSIIRGASGVLIGRLAGFLAVTKSPSARSDNLIYAYGEVPRALDLAAAHRTPLGRRGAHAAGEPGPARRGGPRRLHPGHRPRRVPRAVLRRRLPDRLPDRRAHGAGGEPRRRARRRHHRRDDRRGGRGAPRHAARLAGRDLSAVLDPWQIVLSRDARGGASPDALARMTTSLRARLDGLAASATDRLAGYDIAEDALLAAARQGSGPHPSGPHPSGGAR